MSTRIRSAPSCIPMSTGRPNVRTPRSEVPAVQACHDVVVLEAEAALRDCLKGGAAAACVHVARHGDVGRGVDAAAGDTSRAARRAFDNPLGGLPALGAQRVLRHEGSGRPFERRCCGRAGRGLARADVVRLGPRRRKGASWNRGPAQPSSLGVERGMQLPPGSLSEVRETGSLAEEFLRNERQGIGCGARSGLGSCGHPS